MEFGKIKKLKNRRAALVINNRNALGNSSTHGKQSAPNQMLLDLSFQRVSERKVRNCETDHDLESCGRCRQGVQKDLYSMSFIIVKPAVISSYGVILVASPKGQDSEIIPRHNLCLFVVDDSPLLEEKEALPLVLEDILQTNVLHHTITYAPSKDLDGS
jgi:hypothetical protein